MLLYGVNSERKFTRVECRQVSHPPSAGGMAASSEGGITAKLTSGADPSLDVVPQLEIESKV